LRFIFQYFVDFGVSQKTKPIFFTSAISP